ncbi:MAG: cytochrome P450 [Halioglobus sp.]|nr:cytochrome P450 [Halioglobus sp.]
MAQFTQPSTPQELMSLGPIDPVENPYDIYKALREDNPVGKFANNYYISTFELVSEALLDDETFSSKSNSPDYPGIGMVFGQTIVGMNGKEHLKHKNLVTPALRPRALGASFQQNARNTADRLIDKFAESGSANLVPDFTFLYPLSVFVQILGLPEEDAGDFHRWGIDLTHVATDPERGLRGSACLAEYLEPVVKDKRSNPAGDLICRLIEAEVMGEKMTDVEIISFLRLLITGGADTTYHLLGNVLHTLLSDSALLELVINDRSKLEPLLWESLRWESPVQFTSRQTSREIEIGGVTIPDDSPVFILLGCANRDEKAFARPEVFDINRDQGKSLAFGYGRHYCAGADFGLIEATIGLNALLDRLQDLRFDPSADEASKIRGVAFRGPSHLKVQFNI